MSAWMKSALMIFFLSMAHTALSAQPRATTAGLTLLYPLDTAPL